VCGGRQLTEDEITGLLIAVLFAGQHTSSITSAWTGYEMVSSKVSGACRSVLYLLGFSHTCRPATLAATPCSNASVASSGGLGPGSVCLVYRCACSIPVQQLLRLCRTARPMFHHAVRCFHSRHSPRFLTGNIVAKQRPACATSFHIHVLLPAVSHTLADPRPQVAIPRSSSGAAGHPEEARGHRQL
jgi:hypothetical protein